jgi:nucleotide-binding universal stress UspA family protein
MKRILVPLDGSEFAERALKPAMNMAGRSGAELHLATVISDLPPVPLAAGDAELVSEWFEEEEQRAKTYLSELRGRLSAEATGLVIGEHVRLGSVALTLVGIADELEVDLIALTTHGRGAWQRAWLGSVADQLLRKANRPLLLVRQGEDGMDLFGDEGTPRHVLVPLDGSRASETVLGALPGLIATEGGTRVTIVSVIQRPFPLATTYLPHAVSEERLLQERKKSLEKYLSEVKQKLEGEGLVVGSEVMAGDDAARALLEFVGREQVDLIALSTRGRGGVSRFFLGSVADKLVRGASVPILAVRRPAGDEEEETGTS